MSDKSSKFMTDVFNHSRTSSVVFEENASGDSRRNKIHAKAADKDDTKSVHSGKTNKSKAKIGEYSC